MLLSFEVTPRKTSGLLPGTHFRVTVRADVGPPVCSIARLDDKDGWDLPYRASLTEFIRVKDHYRHGFKWAWLCCRLSPWVRIILSAQGTLTAENHPLAKMLKIRG